MDENNLEDLLHTLDVALTSDNPMIKKALKKFLFIVKMTESEASEGIQGPYMTLLDQIDQLHRRLERLELSQQQAAPSYPYPWTTTSGGSITTTSGTSVTSPTVWTTSPNTYTISDADTYKYLDLWLQSADEKDK